ncbi:hypothetical protein GWI33_014323 [Rhynchophorus ferrugineus]|uniref:Uncharacterized protein n=1 Tax=Rhynchophorus ferrugineus TaxID=354439 RepID=A0A834I7F1_RHYFE|nr:hypothetical protein GWI33_014323 [Rhynchophorus ferrugineus]
MVLLLQFKKPSKSAIFEDISISVLCMGEGEFVLHCPRPLPPQNPSIYILIVSGSSPITQEPRGECFSALYVCHLLTPGEERKDAGRRCIDVETMANRSSIRNNKKLSYTPVRVGIDASETTETERRKKF